MLMVLIPDSSNKTEGCCPRGGGTGGSSGGGSPVPSTRPALGPGIQPLIQNLKAGGGSLFGAAEPWEAWWTRNRESYLNVHQPIEWVKITEGATRSVKQFDVYEKLIGVLIKGVEHKDQYVAFRSAISLATVKTDASLTALKKAYANEKQFFIKNNLTFALGLTGDATPKEVLANKKESILSRCYAAASLGFVQGDPTVIKLLQESISQKDDAEIICCAALSLGNIGDISSVPFLISILNPVKGQELRKDNRIRMHAALALARIARGEVTPETRKSILAEITKSAGDKESDVRAAAVIALGLMKSNESKDTLLGLLKDSNGSVRGLAAISLIQAGVTDNYDVLVKAWQKSSSEDQGLIILALGLSGNEKIKPKFRELLQSRKVNSLTKSAAALALGLLKDKEAVPILLEIMKKQFDDPVMGPYALLALGMIGDPSAVELLQKKWQEIDKKNISATAYTNLAIALTMLGKKDDVVLPVLLKHTAKESEEALKVYAFHTLGILGTRETAQIFVDAYNDESTSTEVRKSIVTGIGFLLDKNNVRVINKFTADNYFDIFMVIMDHILPIPVW
jgi:HEAT repeat protein